MNVIKVYNFLLLSSYTVIRFSYFIFYFVTRLDLFFQNFYIKKSMCFQWYRNGKENTDNH